MSKYAVINRTPCKAGYFWRRVTGLIIAAYKITSKPMVVVRVHNDATDCYLARPVDDGANV
jgi:hypothetical protein